LKRLKVEQRTIAKDEGVVRFGGAFHMVRITGTGQQSDSGATEIVQRC
jgi:hypothetical protein